MKKEKDYVKKHIARIKRLKEIRKKGLEPLTLDMFNKEKRLTFK